MYLCSLVREELSVIKMIFTEREALRTSIEDGGDWDAQTRWMKLDKVISIHINEGYALHHVAHCPSHDK